MKKLTIAAAMSVSLASAAMAGSVSDPIIEADLIVADSGSSSAGAVMSILLLSLIVAVVAD